MRSNPFFRQPHPSDPATLANGLADALVGIVIVAFIMVGALWAPEISALLERFVP